MDGGDVIKLGVYRGTSVPSWSMSGMRNVTTFQTFQRTRGATPVMAMDQF
jgi:hypothetical protein